MYFWISPMSFPALPLQMAHLAGVVLLHFSSPGSLSQIGITLRLVGNIFLVSAQSGSSSQPAL